MAGLIGLLWLMINIYIRFIVYHLKPVFYKNTTTVYEVSA